MFSKVDVAWQKLQGMDRYCISGCQVKDISFSAMWVLKHQRSSHVLLRMLVAVKIVR